MARWWDGAELWVTGLPFIAQVLLSLAIMLPLCACLSRGLDFIVVKVVGGRTAGRKGSHRRRRGA